LRPDVVQVHGLQFGRQAWQLKKLLGPVPILVQDHANLPPQHWLNRFTLRKALRRMDAVSFVSKEQARPWLEDGFLGPNQTVAELMEGSSRFSLRLRAEARARTGLSGSPICLWVGRLNANKDPLTVLRGFGKALQEMPSALLALAYGASDLLDSVHRWLEENPTTAARVRLLGSRPHASLEDLYNSADLFVLGSHHEGSGFAVLEALACGVVPVITDIPSFRVLTDHGIVGGLWQVGSPDALARELKHRYSGLHATTPHQVRAFFDARFSWKAIGSSAIAVYRQLVERAHDDTG
jgi:glycosyltransferase involved in cell wall biosynthesis